MKPYKILAALLSFAMLIMTAPTAFVQAECDEITATRFVFKDTGIEVTEGDHTGYKVSGTDLTLNDAGTYIVSGECSDGSITVKKGTTDVILILDGLTLENTDTAPIACNKSTAVTIIAAEGTVNALTDSEYNNDDNYPDNANDENAVIKCKDGSQVTIGGSGTLNIHSKGKNGIKSGCTTDEEGEAWLTIKDLTLCITTTVNDAITAEQELNVLSGNITVNSADDGIKSDLVLNIGAEGTDGPTVNIEDSYEGIEAATLNIYSGDIKVHSEDDCINAANSDLINYPFSLNIYGGNIYATNKIGDGLDSNGTINISGGNLEVWTPSTADNQPLDADGLITITGGTIFAAGGSSGMPIRVTSTQGYVIFGSSAMGGGQRPGQPGGGFGGDRPGQPGSGSQSSINITAGSVVTVKDDNGNEMYKTTAYCRTVYIFFSSPYTNGGDTYTVYSNDSNVASATAQGGSGNGTQPGGPDYPPEPPTSDMPPEPPTSDMPPEPPNTDNPPEPPMTDRPMDGEYTVIFLDKDGNVISEQKVHGANDVILPEPIEYDHWVFYGWDADLSDVTGDITVHPVYYMIGDVNMNGGIDSADATLMLRTAVGSINLDEFQTKLCDVNKNDVIDAGDATLLLRHIVKAAVILY